MKKVSWAVSALLLAAALGLVAVLSGCGGEAKPTGPAEDTGQTWNLKFSYGIPSASSMGVAYIRPWADAVEEATGGRVQIEHYAEGSLAKDEQEYDFLLSGASDISVVEAEYTAGTFNVFEMGSLPKLFPDPAVCAATMWDVAQKYGDEMSDVKVLGITVIAGAQYIGNKETHVPADVAGQKMRNGGKIEAWLLDSLGAEPIDVELGDLGTALERKTADAAFLSWSLTFISGATRYTEYRTHLDLMYRTWLLVMNKDVWDSMPPNIQDAIMSVSGQQGSVIYSIANELATNESRALLEAADVKLGNGPIYEPTEAEQGLWVQASQALWPKWVEELKGTKSPYKDQGQEILDYVAAQNAKYSGMYDQYLPDAKKVLESRPEATEL